MLSVMSVPQSRNGKPWEVRTRLFVLRERLLHSHEYVHLVSTLRPKDIRIWDEPLCEDSIRCGAVHFMRTCHVPFRRVGRKEILKCRGFKKSGPVIPSRRRGEQYATTFTFRSVRGCALHLQRYSSEPPFERLMITTFAVQRPAPGSKRDIPETNNTDPDVSMMQLAAAQGMTDENDWDEDNFYRVFVLHVTKKTVGNPGDSDGETPDPQPLEHDLPIQHPDAHGISAVRPQHNSPGRVGCGGLNPQHFVSHDWDINDHNPVAHGQAGPRAPIREQSTAGRACSGGSFRDIPDTVPQPSGRGVSTDGGSGNGNAIGKHSNGKAASNRPKKRRVPSYPSTGATLSMSAFAASLAKSEPPSNTGCATGCAPGSALSMLGLTGPLAPYHSTSHSTSRNAGNASSLSHDVHNLHNNGHALLGHSGSAAAVAVAATGKRSSLNQHRISDQMAASLAAALTTGAPTEVDCEGDLSMDAPELEALAMMANTEFQQDGPASPIRQAPAWFPKNSPDSNCAFGSIVDQLKDVNFTSGIAGDRAGNGVHRKDSSSLSSSPDVNGRGLPPDLAACIGPSISPCAMDMDQAPSHEGIRSSSTTTGRSSFPFPFGPALSPPFPSFSAPSTFGGMIASWDNSNAASSSQAATSPFQPRAQTSQFSSPMAFLYRKSCTAFSPLSSRQVVDRNLDTTSPPFSSSAVASKPSATANSHVLPNDTDFAPALALANLVHKSDSSDPKSEGPQESQQQQRAPLPPCCFVEQAVASAMCTLMTSGSDLRHAGSFLKDASKRLLQLQDRDRSLPPLPASSPPSSPRPGPLSPRSLALTLCPTHANTCLTTAALGKCLYAQLVVAQAYVACFALHYGDPLPLPAPTPAPLSPDSRTTTQTAVVAICNGLLALTSHGASAFSGDSLSPARSHALAVVLRPLEPFLLGLSHACAATSGNTQLADNIMSVINDLEDCATDPSLTPPLASQPLLSKTLPAVVRFATQFFLGLAATARQDGADQAVEHLDQAVAICDTTERLHIPCDIIGVGFGLYFSVPESEEAQSSQVTSSRSLPDDSYSWWPALTHLSLALVQYARMDKAALARSATALQTLYERALAAPHSTRKHKSGVQPQHSPCSVLFSMTIVSNLLLHCTFKVPLDPSLQFRLVALQDSIRVASDISNFPFRPLAGAFLACCALSSYQQGDAEAFRVYFTLAKRLLLEAIERGVDLDSTLESSGPRRTTLPLSMVPVAVLLTQIHLDALSNNTSERVNRIGLSGMESQKELHFLMERLSSVYSLASALPCQMNMIARALSLWDRMTDASSANETKISPSHSPSYRSDELPIGHEPSANGAHRSTSIPTSMVASKGWSPVAMQPIIPFLMPVLSSPPIPALMLTLEQFVV